jgi:ketol-acid reductoisomerase
VRVGLRSASENRAVAEGEGLDVVSLEDLARWSDLIMLLAPDETLEDLFRTQLGPNLKAGAAVGFAHGSALHFGAWEFPENADVFLVAPAGPGVELRDRYVRGEGVPAVVAVDRDGSGSARDKALAYAKAIGCTRAGVLLTTVRDEVVIDLFGEQAVLCGGLAELVTSAYETLIESGYSPELAYLECVHQLRITTELIHRFGVDGMWNAISRTALYGSLQRGPSTINETSRREMRETLRRIESGDFFAEFLQDWRTGGKRLAAMRNSARRPEMEATGRKIRRLFGPPENKG